MALREPQDRVFGTADVGIVSNRNHIPSVPLMERCELAHELCHGTLNEIMYAGYISPCHLKIGNKLYLKVPQYSFIFSKLECW